MKLRILLILFGIVGIPGISVLLEIEPLMSDLTSVGDRFGLALYFGDVAMVTWLAVNLPYRVVFADALLMGVIAYTSACVKNSAEQVYGQNPFVIFSLVIVITALILVGLTLPTIFIPKKLETVVEQN